MNLSPRDSGHVFIHGLQKSGFFFVHEFAHDHLALEGDIKGARICAVYDLGIVVIVFQQVQSVA